MIIQKPNGYISIKESAKFLGLTTRTIYRLIDSNKLEYVQLVNKRIYINKQSLIKYGERTCE